MRKQKRKRRLVVDSVKFRALVPIEEDIAVSNVKINSPYTLGRGCLEAISRESEARRRQVPNAH